MRQRGQQNTFELQVPNQTNTQEVQIGTLIYLDKTQVCNWSASIKMNARKDNLPIILFMTMNFVHDEE